MIYKLVISVLLYYAHQFRIGVLSVVIVIDEPQPQILPVPGVKIVGERCDAPPLPNPLALFSLPRFARLFTIHDAPPLSERLEQATTN